jgi:hypothetical protein
MTSIILSSPTYVSINCHLNDKRMPVIYWEQVKGLAISELVPERNCKYTIKKSLAVSGEVLLTRPKATYSVMNNIFYNLA